MSKYTENNNALNSMRLIAALGVLFSHSYPLAGIYTEPFAVLTNGAYSIGSIGVFIFFSISGYLIAQSATRQDSVARFIEARVLRIFPALWICLVFSLLLGVVFTTLPAADYWENKLTWQYLLGNATLNIHFALPAVFSGNPYAGIVNGSLWTLPIEFALYVLVAVLLASDTLKQRSLAAGILIIFVVLWMKPPICFPRVLPPYLGGAEAGNAMLHFLIGVVLFLYKDTLRLSGKHILALLFIAYISRHSPWVSLTFALFFAAFVIWLGFLIKSDIHPWISKNDLSYGVYLYAFPIQQAFETLESLRNHPLRLAAASTPFVLLAAYISWRLIERPALRLKGTLVGLLQWHKAPVLAEY